MSIVFPKNFRDGVRFMQYALRPYSDGTLNHEGHEEHEKIQRLGGGIIKDLSSNVLQKWKLLVFYTRFSYDLK